LNVEPPSQHAAPATRPKKIERPRKLKWRHHLAAFAVFAGLRVLSWTWRLRLIDEHNVLREPIGPVIVCLWHNRLALSMRMWERFGVKKIHSAGLVALISASHDGGVLARVLKYFNVEAVRGSSSRRGPQALLELTSWSEKDYSIAITPDGPRGPRYQIHDGIVALAQITGRSILPASTRVNWKFCLRSWDRFQIPLPFSRCEVRVGPLVKISRDSTEEERVARKTELENQMRALTHD
jgi:lysophospholipid acyltransferase (LPLAT)-like uncharacterized protein